VVLWTPIPQGLPQQPDPGVIHRNVQSVSLPAADSLWLPCLVPFPSVDCLAEWLAVCVAPLALRESRRFGGDLMQIVFDRLIR